MRRGLADELFLFVERQGFDALRRLRGELDNQTRRREMSTTDAMLLERWQRRRDADAFTELVRRHSGMVVSCCRRILGDASLAEDVAQECFIALMQSGDSVRASLGAWLHTIAVRRSVDRIMGDSRRRTREAAFVQGQAMETTRDMTVDEMPAFVDEAIAALPENHRAVVVGRFLQNQTYTDMARDLGVVEGTVRHRVERGVERVRQTLRRKGIAVSAAGMSAALGRAVDAAPAELVVRMGKLAMSGSIVEHGESLGEFAVNAYYPDARHLPSAYVQPAPDGTYTITGLSPGLVTVSAVPNGLRHYVSRTFAIEPGNRIQVDFMPQRLPVRHGEINLVHERLVYAAGTGSRDLEHQVAVVGTERHT